MTVFYSRSFALIRGSIVLDTLGLPVAAIAARAAVAAAARTASTSAASVPASSATAVRPAAAMRTIGAPCAHGFAVRVLAVEVRLAVFVGEVAAALKSDGFFGSRWHRLAPLMSAFAFAGWSTVTLAAP